MTVKEFRDLADQVTEVQSGYFLKQLSKRKLGFRFEQVFNQHQQVIQQILLSSFLRANQSVSENQQVRIPLWMGEQNFQRFISKLSTSCM